MAEKKPDFEKEYLTDEEAEKQYIREKIITKRRKKWLGRLFTLLFVLVCAVLFGIVARVVFILSDEKITDLIGKEPTPARVQVGIREKTNTPAPTPTHRVYPALTPTPEVSVTPEVQITLAVSTPSPVPETSNTPVPKPTSTSTPTPTSQPTATPVPSTPTEAPTEGPEPTGAVEITPEPVPTPNGGEGIADVELTPVPTAEPVQEGDPTAELTPTVSPAAGEDNNEPSVTQTPEEEGLRPTSAVDYITFLSEVMETAKQAVESVVDVEVVKKNSDWLGEYETTTNTSGLIIGNDTVDIIILADYYSVYTSDSVSVTSINVVFKGQGEEKVKAEVYSADKDYGIVILTAKVSNLSETMVSGLNYAIFGKSDEVVLGVPVVAVGRANGHDNSIAIGAITSTDGSVMVRDGEVNYFTVDWPDYPGASAFVFNLNGEVCGMVTHTLTNDLNNGITSCIRISDLKSIIEKYANRRRLTAFGIYGCDIPANVAESSETSMGIYIKEVIAGSPAYAAGLKNGDIIIEMRNEPVYGMETLMAYLVKDDPGMPIKVLYKRRTATSITTESANVVLIEKNMLDGGK